MKNQVRIFTRAGGTGGAGGRGGRESEHNNNNNHYLRAATNPSPDLRPWDAPRCIIRSHSEWGQCTPQHGDSYHRPSLAGGSTAHARWVNVRTTTRSRSGGPIPAPSLYCVFRTFTHTPHHTGWHTRRRFGLLSEAYWFVRALGPISGCRGSHGGSGGDRSERYPRADRNLAPTPFAESGRRALPLTEVSRLR